jgi:MFS family permease
MTNLKMEHFSKHAAFKFVLLLGVVSLFADITYEGARSILGPYLGILGATAAAIGFVAGFGELVGYVLRFFSGYLVDKTAKYWVITFFGYGCNLFAVPLLAFAGNWQVAAFLIILERVGKAVRIPARDAMLSYASHKIGAGKGFGIHETLDRIGAMLGPLIITSILFFKGNYKQGFIALFIPAFLALAVLFTSSRLFPKPQDLESESPKILEKKDVTKSFWYFLIACSLVAAGYVDFPIIAYHFQKTAVMSPTLIPLSYAVAMGSGAASSILFGHLYDVKGNWVLPLVVVLSALFAPLVFLGGETLSIIGMFLWGIGISAQASLMRAVIGNMIPKNKRGRAYGLFNASFGVFWFAGSALMGFLYEISVMWVIAFSLITQLAFVPLFLIAVKKHKR